MSSCNHCSAISPLRSVVLYVPLARLTNLPCRLKGTGVESFACHPGIARTDIFCKADHDKWTSIVTDWAQWLSGQSAETGAMSLMYCAASPDLSGKGGTYYGPLYKVKMSEKSAGKHCCRYQYANCHADCAGSSSSSIRALLAAPGTTCLGSLVVPLGSLCDVSCCRVCWRCPRTVCLNQIDQHRCSLC